MSSPCINNTTAGILVFCVVPFAGAQPLPDLPTLLRDVAAHQRQLDQIRENYTYHRIRQVDDLDKNGAVTKSETIEREVFFVNGRQIGRVVKKNGVPISASEEKAEGERVQSSLKVSLNCPTPREAVAASV